MQTTTLETKRLIQRRLVMADLDALFALYRDPEIRRFIPEGTLTYEETKKGLEWILMDTPLTLHWDSGQQFTRRPMQLLAGVG